MLCVNDEQHEVCPHCKKKILLTQSHYYEGGSSSITVEKDD